MIGRMSKFWPALLTLWLCILCPRVEASSTWNGSHFPKIAATVKKLDTGVTNRFWKVYGPDTSGVYGGAMGIGGLEAVIDEATGDAVGVVNDVFHNIIETHRYRANGAAIEAVGDSDFAECSGESSSRTSTMVELNLFLAGGR